MRCGWLACGEVPDISSGMASHDTRMSDFFDAFLLACNDSDVLPLVLRTNRSYRCPS